MFCKRKVVVDEDEDLMKIEFEILEEVDVVLMFDQFKFCEDLF